MSVYVVTGKLGTGKGKFAVMKIREAMLAGRRVATNLDIFPEHLVPARNRIPVLRIPDKPTADDLKAIGHGAPDSPYDESTYGILVLDELGSWLNTRAFQDKSRADLIEWLLHARKLGWHVYLTIQNIEMLDKQVRVGIAEYIVKLLRLDRLKIPVIGMILGNFGKMPRMHIANYTLSDAPGFVVDREMFRGDDLQKGYDTLQVFSSDYKHGPHSLLSAWHLKGRYGVEQATNFWHKVFPPRVIAPVPLKPKLRSVSSLAGLPPDEAFAMAAQFFRGS